MEQIFSKAWEHFKEHWVFLSIVSAIGMLAPAALIALPMWGFWQAFKSGAITFDDFGSFFHTILASVGILGTLGIIVALIAAAGLMNAALIITKGGKPEIRDLFLPFGTYLKGFGALLICGILMVIGYVLCVVPGLIFTFLFTLVPYEIFNNPNAGAMDAIKTSWNLMKSDWKTTLLVWLICFLINTILGSTVIGMIPAYPFTYLAMAVLYRKLKGEYTEAAPQIEAAAQ